jgi:Zn-dependent metalloprotease
MAGRSRSIRYTQIMLAAALALLSALAAAPATLAVAQLPASSCAVAKTDAKTGVARWLEGCGNVAMGGSPEAIARGVLKARAPSLGLRADGGDLALSKVDSVAGVTYVRFAQTHKGVPVYLGQVLVQYSQAGTVQLINNHTLPNLNVDITPSFDGDAAIGARGRRSPAPSRAWCSSASW